MPLPRTNSPMTIGSRDVWEGEMLSYVVHLAPTKQARSMALDFSGSAKWWTGDLAGLTFSNGVTQSNGLVYIPAGVSTFTVNIGTRADADGWDETLTLKIGSTFETAIIRDKNPPIAAVASVQGTNTYEGGVLTFKINLKQAYQHRTAIQAWFGADTAENNDYRGATATNGVVFKDGKWYIPSGVSSFSIQMPTVKDRIPDNTETVRLWAGYQKGQAVFGEAKIIDDWHPEANVKSVKTSRISEGGILRYVVDLATSQSVETSVNFRYGADSSEKQDILGVRYAGARWENGKLIIPPNTKQFFIFVYTKEDVKREGNETVRLWVGNKYADGTILDDDSKAIVSSVKTGSTIEGGKLTFTVNLAQAYKGQTTVDLKHLAGTTVSSADLTASYFSNGVYIGRTENGVQPLYIPAGVKYFTITYDTKIDGLPEGAEYLQLSIGGVAGTAQIYVSSASQSGSLLQLQAGLAPSFNRQGLPNEPSWQKLASLKGAFDSAVKSMFTINSAPTIAYPGAPPPQSQHNQQPSQKQVGTSPVWRKRHAMSVLDIKTMRSFRHGLRSLQALFRAILPNKSFCRSC
jgi:hypothetical protein